MAVRRSRSGGSGTGQKRYAEHLCRPGMPNTYAEQVDTETTFGKESAPEGYAEEGMPNTYAEQGMPNTVASLPTLNVSRPYIIYIYIYIYIWRRLFCSVTRFGPNPGLYPDHLLDPNRIKFDPERNQPGPYTNLTRDLKIVKGTSDDQC